MGWEKVGIVDNDISLKYKAVWRKSLAYGQKWKIGIKTPEKLNKSMYQMELQTLFRRESAAGSYSIRI